MSSPYFNEEFKTKLKDLFIWRRDVRHFKPNPIPIEILNHLLEFVSLSPSVGLSEPWRFMKVDDPLKRQKIYNLFLETNRQVQDRYSTEEKKRYQQLKLSGLEDAPHHIAVFCDNNPLQGKGLGRKTMPETIQYSTVMAIYSFWLAARAYGIGVGWVSILQPKKLIKILETPTHWQFIAYLCVGYPKFEQAEPELQSKGWEKRNNIPLKWDLI